MPRKADPALADSRRHEILDAAGRCFVRRGLHATSMREIFSEAGLSAGAVYNYFESKEAIIEAMAARERSEIEELAAYLQSTADKRTAILDAIEEVILECSVDDARLDIELLAEASRNDRIKTTMTANDIAMRDSLLEVISKGQTGGLIGKALAPEALLEAITAIYEGFIGRIAFDPKADRRALARTARIVVDRLLA